MKAFTKIDDAGRVQAYELSGQTPMLGGAPVDSLRFTTFEKKLGRVTARYLLRAAPDALVGLAKAATPAAKGLLGMAGPLAKLAAKGGGLMMAGAAGYALGKVLYDRVPGLRMFGDALGEGIGRLIGFRDTISDAEAAQKGLANSSAGVQQAIDQVQKGIVDDYESDSYAHMVAARQLKDMRDDDLAAYAESIAKRTGMSKDELMQRLRTLRAEQVDDRKFREAREKMIKSMSPIELSAAVAREAGALIGRRREGEDEAAGGLSPPTSSP